MDWAWLELGSAVELCPVNLYPPPAHADKQETPVAEELRGLAFKGVAEELKQPSEDEESEGIPPKAMKKETEDEDGERNKNCGNAEGMAKAIDRMLVAGRVFRDPLFAGTVPEHAGEHDTTPALRG